MKCKKDIGYPSKDIAARMGALLRQQHASKKQIPYPCLECRCWHLRTRKSHRSSGQLKRRRS